LTTHAVQYQGSETLQFVPPAWPIGWVILSKKFTLPYRKVKARSGILLIFLSVPQRTLHPKTEAKRMQRN
jgi:hypothetical protein